MEVHLTQEQLAEKANLSRNYIGLLESDQQEPSLSTLLALARALQVNLDAFMPTSLSVVRKESRSKKKIDALLAQCSEKELEAVEALLKAGFRLKGI